jgi:broad specificity phosphatase PhoE
MTEIGLIRHGSTEWNKLKRLQGTCDLPINDEGKKQAHKLASRLDLDEKWDLIITSNLLRAKETGKIIGEKLKIPIHSDNRIQEINFGKIEGTTEADRIRRWGHDWRQLDLGKEKDEVVIKRGFEFLKAIIKKYYGRRILIVSHGGFLLLIMQRLFSPELYIGLTDNTALSILKYSDSEWHCSLYNCSKHLI